MSKACAGPPGRAAAHGRWRTERGRRTRPTRAWRAAAVAAAAALSLPSAARAETTSYRINETHPYETVLVSCTGEPVALTGRHHVEGNYRVTVDLSGTRFHSQTLNKYSLRGTGTLSGAVYQNQQEEMSEHNGTFTLDSLGGWAPYEETTVTNMVLIRQGESTRLDDLHVRLQSHVTYTANGVPITRPPTLEIICR